MEQLPFFKFTLPPEGNSFAELSATVDFEDVGKGRKGNHLSDVSDAGVPIVRTTTQYTRPAHRFSPAHHALSESIRKAAEQEGRVHLPQSPFNNALIEIYEASYWKMGYHSDQALDLEADSWIALFSCYERPEDLSRDDLRKLKIKDKTTNDEAVISLENNSVVLFSSAANALFQHKIVLDHPPAHQPPGADNRWLGITLRKSKTLIHFEGGVPLFQNGNELKIANETQQKEFYQLRGQENRSLGFVYPEIGYTLSVADRLMPRT